MTTPTYNLFRFVAVAGNVIFILWMLFNAMDEPRGTSVEVVSVSFLILLLILNIVLLTRKEK